MNFAKLMKAQLAILENLFEAAQAENRDLTEDEQKQYDAAQAEYNRLKAAAKTADDLKAMKDAIPAPAVVVEPAQNSAAQANQNIEVGGDLRTSAPYENLGTMLLDVARQAGGNGEANDRLIKAELNTQTGADGGFLIPPDFVGAMLEAADAQSQLFSRCTELTPLGNSVSIPGVDEVSRADGSRFGGISVQWLTEGGEGDYSQPKFKNLDIKLSKLAGFVAVTSEMLEDAALLSSWVNAAFPAELAFVLDQAIFNGDGNGKPLGFMNSAALVTIAKQGSQAADTVVYENIVKMWARMPARRFGRSVWLINQQVLEQLPLMNLSVGTGGAPVFLPMGGASVEPYGTLMGRPIVPIEQAAKLGDLGDISLVDLSDYIAITKGGLKTASSIHVYFNTDKSAFRFIRRVNGAPYTRTSLASRADATFVTSPYITLAARA